jgi:hypothetical protein
VRILVLVPKQSTFLFSLTCSDGNSKDFHSWLKQGQNNNDFLTEQGLMKDAEENSYQHDGLITFTTVKGALTAQCNQANMMMAFLTARKLGMRNDGILRFTYIDHFLACLRNKIELCDLISANFNLIVVGPDADIRKAGKNGNAAVQQIHHFCGYDLLRARVFTYPPLSFMYFFEDKVKRDEVFETLKLPFVYINVTSCMIESAEKAFTELKTKYADDEHVSNIPKFGMVAKSINNHCGLGVYILERRQGSSNCWEITGDNKHPFVEEGTKMRFEPFVSELKQSETRIYATLIPGQRVSLHYKVETSFGPRGITLEKPATLCQNTARGSAERKLVKDAYHLFCTKFPHLTNALMHLTLRFDIFCCCEKFYLNEVDVIPIAYLFLDDYFGTSDCLMKLSETMAMYIRNNWNLWPA